MIYLCTTGWRKNVLGMLKITRMHKTNWQNFDQIADFTRVKPILKEANLLILKSSKKDKNSLWWDKNTAYRLTGSTKKNYYLIYSTKKHLDKREIYGAIIGGEL